MGGLQGDATQGYFLKELSKPEHSQIYQICRALGPRSAEKLGLGCISAPGCQAEAGKDA